MATYDLDDPEGMQQEYTPAMIIHIVQTDSIRNVFQRKASPAITSRGWVYLMGSSIDRANRLMMVKRGD